MWFGCDVMDIDEFVLTGKRLYEKTKEPIAITDSELNAVWANEAALNRYPSLSLQDGVHELISSYDFDTVLSQLKTGVSFEAKKQSEPLSGFKAQLVPILIEDKFIGCHVFIKNAEKNESVLPDGEPEKIIASFSNEYKIPLTVIFSTLGLMARRLEDSGDEVTKTYLKLITQNCYRLLRLSNNITEVSRYRSGIAKLNLKKGNLTKYISNLCEACKILTSSINIELDYIVPEKNIITVFDPDRLSTAIINLISNSCKYTRDGNHIVVKLEDHGEKAVISVSDKGQGIKSEIMGRIFDPYFSFRNESELSGAGLGLSIVKFIVTQHGGTVALQSKEGEGTTVALSLPIRVDVNMPDYIAKNGADYLADRFSSLYVELSDVCGCPLP